MSKFTIITTALATTFTIGAALAAEPGQRSRAEVRAELDQARVQGELGVLFGEDSGSFHLSRQAARSTLTRGEVRAELARAVASGEAGALASEDSGSAYLAMTAPRSVLTRAQVVADVKAAIADGTLAQMVGEDSGSFALSVHRQPQRYLASTSPSATAALTCTDTGAMPAGSDRRLAAAAR